MTQERLPTYVVIQLTQDLPIDPKHGMVAGRQFVAVRHNIPAGTERLWTVISDVYEEVLVISSEAIQLEEKEQWEAIQ